MAARVIEQRAVRVVSHCSTGRKQCGRARRKEWVRVSSEG